MFNLSSSIRTSQLKCFVLSSLLVGSAFIPFVQDTSAQSAKSVVERQGPIGRTIAFRPLSEKNIKKGLKYQVFETTVTAYVGPDTTLRDSIVTVNDVVLNRVTDGYTVGSTPRTVKRFVNDKVEEDLVTQLAVGITATLHLGPTGLANEFTGLENIEKKIKSQFPADSAAALIKAIGGSGVKMKAINEWNGRMGNLLNREMVIGEAKFDTVYVQFPNGHRVLSYIVSRIEDTIRIQGVWHVKIRISAATSPKDISTVSKLPLRDIIRAFRMPDSVLREYSLNKGVMVMHTDLLLEMNTLLLKSEEFERRFEMEPELKNTEPVFTRSTVYKRTLRYQY